MENTLLKKILDQKQILFVASLFFVFPFLASAYSSYYTHPDLTAQMAKLYNIKKIGATRITDQELGWMREGAIREDEPPRWINHFYDPVHGVGWSGKHLGTLSPEEALRQGSNMSIIPPQPSIYWVTNQEAQATYQQFGNQTWQKAIWSYVNGDEVGAFRALGHVLHLVEDTSVPDHTRDDSHPGLFGDPGSPYEHYTEDFTNAHVLNYAVDLAAIPLPSYSTVSGAMIDMAKYSNKNYFSEDTIFKDFDYPSLGDAEIIAKDDYYYDIAGETYLAKIIRDRFGDRYTTNDADKVLPSYKNNLFPRVILTGTAVIKLFFDEVAKYKQNQASLEPLVPDRWFSDFELRGILWEGYYTSKAAALAQDVISKTAADKQVWTRDAEYNYAFTQFLEQQNMTGGNNLLPISLTSNIISLPLIFTPTPGSLTSPISIAGVLKIPIQELQNILSRAPESAYFGYLGTQNNPAVFVNSENDPIYSLLKPYLTTTNNDATSLALKQVANAVVDLNNKTNKITTESEVAKKEALKEVEEVVTSTKTVPLDWLTNYYQQIEKMLPGYGQQFTTEAECKAAGWEWDDRYNRGFVINYGQTATPYGNTPAMLNLIPGGYYVQFNNSGRVYQKQGSLWVPIIGYAGSDYVKIPTPPSATNLLPDDYGIYVNNLKPVTLYSPYYLGGINYYQDKTTGQLYRDPDGQNPVDAAQAAGFASAGYRATDGLSYTQAMNSTGAVNPLIQGGGSVVTGSAVSTYLANQSGNIYSNQICLAPQTTTKPLGLLDQAMNFISSAYNTVKNTINWIADAVSPIVNSITKAVTKAVKTAATIISNAVSTIVSKAQAAVNSVVQFSSQVNSFLVNTVASVVPKVSYVYNNVVAGVKTFLGVLGF